MLLCFYHEIVARRYPDTSYAERAEERMTELKKQLDKREEIKDPQVPEARVGEIFIAGTKKLSATIILEQVPLFPGQILTWPDVQSAERNWSRLNGLKKHKIEVIDAENGGVFKDIRITVVEK